MFNPTPKRINIQNPLHLPPNPRKLLFLQTQPRRTKIPQIRQDEPSAQQRRCLLMRMRDTPPLCFGILDFVGIHLHGLHLAAEEEGDAGTDVRGEGADCGCGGCLEGWGVGGKGVGGGVGGGEHAETAEDDVLNYDSRITV